MTRKTFLRLLVGIVVAPLAASARLAAEGIEKLKKPLAEWRRLLPEAAYEVLFEEDTERPWSSALNDEKRSGTFICAACYLPLFDAATKYDSGTGWPSFYAPIDGRLATKRDWKLIDGRLWCPNSRSVESNGASGLKCGKERPEGLGGSKRDWKLIVPRTEYHCVRCEGHQGHLFKDGPPPTGQRWCNNGLALAFVPEGEPVPELRS